ncbi:zinc finger protein 570-like isoform X1 [Schistocerca americana]|uniref:zinc finger protein 570-like isoform X1 n=2 Tax=Schistocerca americana TaxID=7009 RepID=UPI001F501098|nr:zinc finger protein 570-like isoform X1 [Schistocerca americana]
MEAAPHTDCGDSKMPLLKGTTANYICHICRQSHENLITLHRHHVSAHTSEELSFAMIALNGWTFTSSDGKVIEGSVDSVTHDGICGENDSTATETVKQSDECLSDISLPATSLADDGPVNLVPFYNENSPFKLSDVPLDMSILHDSGGVSERSVKPAKSAQPLYGGNNLNVPVMLQDKQRTAISGINERCDHSASAVSSDDFSGSETETDIEVNGSGRLFDSDYDIKIDIFDEYEDLEIEEGSRPLSPTRNEDSTNNLTVAENSSMECSSRCVLGAASSQNKVVKKECINDSLACVTEGLNNTFENEIMPCTSDKNCTLACTDTHSHKNNQSVFDDTNKVNDKCSEITASDHNVVEFSKTLTCSAEYNDSADLGNSVDCHKGNRTLQEVFVPLVETGSAEYRHGICGIAVTNMSTVDELSSLHRNSSPLCKISEKEELLENSKIYCGVESVCNPAPKMKIERLDPNSLTVCTSTSEIISNQIIRKDTVPVYRCAITCVTRSGGFFKAKVDPGPLKDATISKVAERRFFCESCGKGYKKKSHLERHLRAHTGERPFQCSYCTKRFAVRSILKQHVRIHTGEKPYCCSVCLQRFPQKSGLMTHMMLHTGKPFKCDLCEKSFVSNHKLLQHLKSHESQNIYSCSECKTKFFTEGALREHGKIHSEAKLERPAWQVDFLQKDF